MEKILKNITAMLCVVLLACALAGCSASSASTATPSTTQINCKPGLTPGSNVYVDRGNGTERQQQICQTVISRDMPKITDWLSAQAKKFAPPSNRTPSDSAEIFGTPGVVAVITNKTATLHGVPVVEITFTNNTANIFGIEPASLRAFPDLTTGLISGSGDVMTNSAMPLTTEEGTNRSLYRVSPGHHMVWYVAIPDFSNQLSVVYMTPNGVPASDDVLVFTKPAAPGGSIPA